MRKRHFLRTTALLLMAVLIFTGCLAKNVADMAGDCIRLLKSSKSEDTSEQKEYINPGLHARDLLAEIIECFNSGDKERLKNFFCMKSINHPQFDADIDEAFDFIDGEIIACSEVICDGGSRRDENFEVIITSYSAETYIVTDKGAEYEIRIAGKLYDAEDQRNEGLGLIELVNENIEIPERHYGWWEHREDYKEYIYFLE